MAYNKNNRKNQYRGKNGKTRRENTKEYEEKKSSKNTGAKEDKYDAADTKYCNDPAWYFDNEELMDLASRFSFGTFLGEEVPFNKGKMILPTTLRLQLAPYTGLIGNSPMTAGINLQAFRNYVEFVAQNGKTTSYAPQDVMIPVLAIGSVIELVEYIRRFFGLYTFYNYRNRTVPKVLLEQLGLDVDDFIYNIADYMKRFNVIITEAQAILMPKDIAYFDKCASLYKDIYLDSDSQMAQVIANVPDGVWVFDEAYNDNGSGLHYTSLWRSGEEGWETLKMREMMDILENMVQKLLSSTTLNMVYADILNYQFKRGVELWTFDMVSDGYVCQIKYDETFLMMLENAYVMGVPYGTSLDVKSNADLNALECDLELRAKVPYTIVDKILNFSKIDPNAKDRVEASRLVPFGGAEFDSDNNTWAITNVNCSDHFITLAKYYVNGGVEPVLTYGTSMLDASSTSVSYESIHILSKFSKHPRFIIVKRDSVESTDFTSYYDIEDLDYFTFVDEKLTYDLNKQAMMGLFKWR